MFVVIVCSLCSLRRKPPALGSEARIAHRARALVSRYVASSAKGKRCTVLPFLPLM